MDGASVGAESLWPSAIRWKSMFSSNWKNIKNRWGGTNSCLKKKAVFLKPETSSVNPVHNAQVCYFNNVHYARGSH